MKKFTHLPTDMNHSPSFAPNHPPGSKQPGWLPVMAVGICCFFTLGCTSQEAKENLDTTLCWLRPSCLPHHPSSSRGSQASKSSVSTRTIQKRPPARAVPSRTSSKQNTYTAANRQKSPRKPTRKRTTGAPKCLTSASLTVKASKPSVTISYVEPTTKADGRPLTNLAKTTIYQDFGKGLVKYKDIPATNPKGGGKIEEVVVFTLGKRDSITTKICITATDKDGLEG